MQILASVYSITIISQENIVKSANSLCQKPLKDTKIRIISHQKSKKDIKKAPDFGLIKLMERVMRIELTYTAWKAVVLPLNYTRMS